MFQLLFCFILVFNVTNLGGVEKVQQVTTESRDPLWVLSV